MHALLALAAITLRLAVPPGLRGGEAAPVLKLEGFEFVAGERLRLEVLGPHREVLAVSSLVGSANGGGEVGTMDLVIPLNERGRKLLAKNDEVTLTLRVRRGRHRLKWKRAYLTSG